MVRLHVLQLAACAALVAVCDAAKGAKCSAVLCSGVSVSDPATILNDMGNSAPADLIMKSSYEDWSINELTLLKSGVWPTSGDVCTAGADCAMDADVEAKCSGTTALEIAKANHKMSVTQISAICGGGSEKKSKKKKKKK